MRRSVQSSLASEVIICTRNRPADLARCLRSVLEQDVVPTVSIVDSSDGRAAEDVCILAKTDSSGTKVRYTRSPPGLTKQRNLGVRLADPGAEVLHFIDDDVEVCPSYFASTMRVFENDHYKRIGGVGGLIQNAPERRVNMWNRFFLLDSKRQGVVLPSGWNVMVFDAEGPLTVEWLSGCSMSYRREVFEEISFDESMEGYSWGEDLDFGYRASRRWTLIVTPSAQLVHHLSPHSREDRHRLARSQVASRYRFVAKHIPGFWGTLGFWWSLAGEVLISLAKGITRASLEPWRQARSLALGAIDVWRNRSKKRVPVHLESSENKG